MESLSKPGVLNILKGTKRIPSNRARPPSVPTQRYPSWVCTTAVTLDCGNPESVPKLSKKYCPASARAAAASARKTTNGTARSRRPSGRKTMKADHFRAENTVQADWKRGQPAKIVRQLHALNLFFSGGPVQI